MRTALLALAGGILLFLPAAALAQAEWEAGIAKVIPPGLKAPGTAFVVAMGQGRAYLVTSAHVVEGVGNTVLVEFLAAPDRTMEARVQGGEFGDSRGLAYLTVTNPPDGVRALAPSAEPVSRLDDVVVAGFPGAVARFFAMKMSIGDAAGRDLTLDRETGVGFSGGPVLKAGKVVGIVYGREGLGRALKVSSVKDYLDGYKIEWTVHGLSGGESRSDRPSASAKTGRKAPEQEGVTVSQRKLGDTFTNPKDDLTYRWIPPGIFRMGCSVGDTECSVSESPAHDVEISRGFWMGETEVTQAAWRRVMKTAPSYFEGDTRPVEQVSWEDAERYCEAIGGRLPTEAEWEYAARAGTTGARYGALGDIAWYGDNSGTQPLNLAEVWEKDSKKYAETLRENGNATHTVGGKKPNEWSLYDMLGNVWEWVADWYGPYESKTQSDPRGPATGKYRALRGGSWNDDPRDVRASFRFRYEPTDGSSLFGFRCAREFP